MNRHNIFPTIFLMMWLMTACVPQAGPTVPSGESQGTPAPVEKIHLNVCYSSKSPTQEANWYALDKGIYEKYGLDVSLVSINGGAKAAAALISKDMDFCTMASPSLANAVVAGEDLAMTAGFYNRNIYYIIVSPEINNPENLRGKTIASGLPGGAQDTMGRIGLKNLGLIPDKDVGVIALEEESQKVAALESNRVVGVVVHPPTNIVLEEKGYKVLLDLSTLDVAYQGAGVVTRRSYIQEHRDIVIRFNQAILESIVTMKKDQAGSVEVMSRYLDYDLKADQYVLERTYQTLILQNLLSDPIPSKEGLQVVLDEAALENPAAVNVKPDDLVDMSILDELKANGFMETLQ